MKLFLSLMVLIFVAACQGYGDKAAMTLDNKDGMGVIRLARSALEAGDADSASNILKQGIFNDKTRVEYYYELAALYNSRNKQRDAINTLEDGTKANPKDVTMIRKLGNIYLTAGQVEKAIVTYDGGLALAKDDAKLLSSKAVALDIFGKKKEARELYAKAIAGSKGASLAAQNNLAMSHLMAGETSKAIEILEKNVTNASASPQMRQNLALAYVIKGDVEKAKKISLRDLSESETKQNIDYYKVIAANMSGGGVATTTSDYKVEHAPQIAPVAVKNDDIVQMPAMLPTAGMVAPQTANATEEEIEKPRTKDKKWFIDMGVFENRLAAEKQYADVIKLAPQLAKVENIYTPTAGGKEKLVFGAFNDYSEFGDICKLLIAKKFTCNIIQQ